jgi:hypothetical protein
MQERYTAESRRNKLSPFPSPSVPALESLDLDRFLARGPYVFWDPALDAAPSAKEVATLARLGVPGALPNKPGNG